MAYIKNNWVDREGTTRYFETVDSDGAKIFTPDYTQVTELGTPVNADNMNHIEEGIAAGSFTKFDLNATYAKDDLVTVIEEASPVIYKSLIDNNIGNALSSSIAWEKISLGGGGLEIGDIGIAPLGIDETKGKRRYLNGQLIIQEQYVQFTNKVKSAVALYPSLACTESEWQTTATMTVGGQVGKFVVDDEAGTIRLPKIIMPIQGLTDLSKLAEIVEAGLPNIKGEYTGNACREYGKGTGAFTEKDKSNYSYSGFTASGSGKLNTLIFDASLSNPIYGNSNTVQQEQIQYPYFIQVATGAETEDNIVNTLELNNPYVLLEPKFFGAEVYNISWLLANGSYNGSNAVHPSAYQALVVENNEEVAIGSTVTLPIGTEYTKRGLSVKLSTDSDITDYDFVLNTAEETFRLPIKVKLASGKAVVGNGVTLGVTNGTTNAGLWGGSATAAFNVKAYGSSIGVSGQTTSDLGNKTLGITTDATKSGIETSDSDLYLYFYVGETVQNANLINAGRIEETLVNKVDVSSSWGFPSNRYIDLTLGASGTTYTAPANGWFCINKTSTAGTQRVTLLNENSSIQVTQNSSVTNQTLACYVPIKKGETCKVVYDAGGTLAFFRFVYAEGDR